MTVLEVYSAGEVRRNDKPQIKGLPGRPATLTDGKKPSATIVPEEAAAKVEVAKKKKEIDKKKMMIYGVLAFLAYIAFFSTDEKVQTFREKAKLDFEDEPTPKKKLDKKEMKEAMSEFVSDRESDTAQRKDAQVFFRYGIRELQNKNYRRAMTAFETALTVDPTHELAKIYLKTTIKEMEGEIKSTSAAALQARKSLRFKEARMNYENIIRYLGEDTQNKEYVKAQEGIRELEKEESKAR